MNDEIEAPDDRHLNPSGLSDLHAAVVSEGQPVDEKHHEEGHVDPPEPQETQP